MPDKTLKFRAQHAVKNRNWQEAELLYRQLIVHLEYLFGTHHFDIATSYHALADILEKQGKTDEAIKLRERTSEILLHLNQRL